MKNHTDHCGVKKPLHHFSELTGKLYHSINDCPQQAQQMLAAQSVFLDASYLKSLEDGCKGIIDCKYTVISDSHTVSDVICFQVINLSNEDLSNIIRTEPYSKLMSAISGMIGKYIFGVKKHKPHYLVIAGSVLVSGEYYGVVKEKSEAALNTAFRLSLNLIRNELNKNGKIIAEIIKDFKADEYSDPCPGFTKFAMDPVMELNIRPEWNAFSDYLEALSAKYRLRCNNARKKISGFTVKYLSQQEIIAESAIISQLYNNVQERAPIRLATPGINYLIELASMPAGNFFFKAFYLNNKMVMFSTGLFKSDHLEAHHIGMDYDINKTHSLYLNLLYDFIEEAINRKASLLSYGRTAMEMKTTVGAVPSEYVAFLKMGNAVLNKIVGACLPEESNKEWVPRNPFRQ